MSWTFAAVTCATSGTPRASVTMWCLDPALRRSVGFGPVFSPRIARTDPLSTTVQRPRKCNGSRRAHSASYSLRRLRRYTSTGRLSAKIEMLANNPVIFSFYGTVASFVWESFLP